MQLKIWRKLQSLRNDKGSLYKFKGLSTSVSPYNVNEILLTSAELQLLSLYIIGSAPCICKKQPGVALTGRNITGPPWSVGRPTTHVGGPLGRPAIMHTRSHHSSVDYDTASSRKQYWICATLTTDYIWATYTKNSLKTYTNRSWQSSKNSLCNTSDYESVFQHKIISN